MTSNRYVRLVLTPKEAEALESAALGGEPSSFASDPERQAYERAMQKLAEARAIHSPGPRAR